MQIEILDTLDQIQALKPDWDELFDRTRPGLFMHHSWVYNNYRLLQKGRIVMIAVYADPKRLVGVFPFAVKEMRIKWKRFDALVHGGSVVTDYSLFMLDPESNHRLMIKRVIEKLAEIQPDTWDLICIENLNNAMETSRLFINLALRQFYAGTVSTEITPVIDLERPYSEAKKISNIKRRFRKIADACETIHLKGDEIDEESLGRFSALHKIAFPEASFDNEDTQQFYRALIDDADFRQHVCLSMIEHEGEMIAAHFGFEDDRTFYYYVPTYNDNYSTYGPGQYLLWQLITGSHEIDRKVFDLLRGNEDYKFNWTNSINTNKTLFGIPLQSGRLMRTLTNLWLLTRHIPSFTRDVN